MPCLRNFNGSRQNFVEIEKYTVTRNDLPWSQTSFLQYFDAISTILTNFDCFFKRSALNPHTGSAPGPPLVTPQPSKIYRKSIQHQSTFDRHMHRTSNEDPPKIHRTSIEYPPTAHRKSTNIHRESTSIHRGSTNIYRTSIDHLPKQLLEIFRKSADSLPNAHPRLF